MNLLEDLKRLIDSIPDSGLTCILAGVGLHRQYQQQLKALTQTGKMELLFFQSTEQIREALGSAEIKFEFLLYSPRLHFLFSDSRVGRSTLIILVETKNLKYFWIFYFFFSFLVFWFSDFLIFCFSSNFFSK